MATMTTITTMTMVTTTNTGEHCDHPHHHAPRRRRQVLRLPQREGLQPGQAGRLPGRHRAGLRPQDAALQGRAAHEGQRPQGDLPGRAPAHGQRPGPQMGCRARKRAARWCSSASTCPRTCCCRAWNSASSERNWGPGRPCRARPGPPGGRLTSRQPPGGGGYNPRASNRRPADSPVPVAPRQPVPQRRCEPGDPREQASGQRPTATARRQDRGRQGPRQARAKAPKSAKPAPSPASGRAARRRHRSQDCPRARAAPATNRFTDRFAPPSRPPARSRTHGCREARRTRPTPSSPTPGRPRPAVT
jgi:hypothetical protein